MIPFDSSEIDRWSDLPDAHHRFPELIRRLVLATVSNPSRLDFPSGSSVRLPGWDGLVDVEEGNAWVPSGASAWELSCESNRTLTGKATSDYQKRTTDPLDVDIPNTTFVFATPRRWTGKRRWIRGCRKEGSWYNVRAFDADDLVAWLELAPEVSIWFARLIGKLPASTEDILPLLNRQESLHIDTRSEFNRSLEAAVAEIKADFRHVLAQSPDLTEEGNSLTPLDPAHLELSEQIDFAVGLIKRGLVRSARVELERIKNRAQLIPDDLHFRIITNLAACALAEEDSAGARTLFEKAHELQPNNQKGITNAALAAQLGQDREHAMELALKVRESDQTDPQATAVLIETYWDTGNIEKLEELVASEAWVSEDKQCALVLASIRVRQSRFEEAATLCRTLIESDSEDASAHLALSQFLLNYAQADRHLVGYTHDWDRRLREAEKEATLAVDILRATELVVELHRALVTRACARSLLGQTSQAMCDFDEVLRELPTHPDAAFNKGLFLLSEGQPAEARVVLERIEDAERKADAASLLAEACLASGDAAEAIRLLKGNVTLAYPSLVEVHKADILCRAEAKIGGDDSITSPLEVALTLHPENSPLLMLDAVWRSHHDDQDGAEKSLVKALEFAVEADRLAVLVQLAVHYETAGKFSEAADQWGEVVGDVASQPAAIHLLTCLVNSQRLREALDWARKIREVHPHPPRIAVEVEAQILQQVGDVRAAVLRYHELCSRDDASASDQVLLAMAQLRCGEWDAATKTVHEIRASDLRHDPRSILKLSQLKLLLGLDGYIEDAYMGRLCGINEPTLHLGYFGLFLAREEDWVEPEIVGPGCAVLLRNEGTERWWQILDNGEESHSSQELSPSQELAQRLLGRRVGDTIVLRQGIEDLVYEVAAVQSKFVRAFQETSEDFSTRFPENMNLFRVRVEEDDLSKIFQTVDRRAQFVHLAERLYREGTLPFATFSSLVGISTIEGWNAFTKNPSNRFRFGDGTNEEESLVSGILPETSGLVLDLTALLSVHELGIAEHLRSRFSRIVIPQQVIDEIQQVCFITKLHRPGSAYLGKEGDGTYTWAEMPENYWTQRQEYLRSLLNLAESFDTVAAYRLLDSSDFETLVEVLTPAGVGAVYAGDERPTDGLVLVSDDLGLSGFARSLGINAVNIQGVLWELSRSNVITRETYSSLIEKLLLLNYWFVHVSADDILRRLEASGFLTTPGIHAMLKTLEGPDCSDDAAVSVGARLIIQLAGVAPHHQVDLLLSAVLATLRRGRETSSVLLKFRNVIAGGLNLAPFTRGRLLRTVDLYLRI